MSIVLQGSTSGSITLQEPAVAGSNTISLPAATGTAVLTGVSGNVDINAAGSNNLTLSTNSTERVRVDSSGRVGIGTTSPNVELDVNGNLDLRASTTQTRAIQVGHGRTGNGYALLDLVGDATYQDYGTRLIRFDTGANAVSRLTHKGTGNLEIYAEDAAPMVFYTNLSERMRISSNGYVSINTTGTAIAGANNHLSIVANNIWNTAYAIGLRNLGTTTGGFFVNFANSSDTSIGSISQNTTTSVAYNTTSDYRLKENIAPMTGALAKVAELKPCTYTWKETGEAGQGFIAHELQEVVPDAVTGEKDAVFPNGKPRYQGVDTSFLVATLTAALQELKGIVDTQATKIAELEAKLEGTA